MPLLPKVLSKAKTACGFSLKKNTSGLIVNPFLGARADVKLLTKTEVRILYSFLYEA